MATNKPQEKKRPMPLPAGLVTIKPVGSDPKRLECRPCAYCGGVLTHLLLCLEPGMVYVGCRTCASLGPPVMMREHDLVGATLYKAVRLWNVRAVTPKKEGPGAA